MLKENCPPSLVVSQIDRGELSIYYLYFDLFQLTIRASPNDLSCLSRLSDYSVEFDAICSTEIIELVRLSLLEPMGRCRLEKAGIRFGAKRPHLHLRAFRDWIDSDQLKEKYVQQYSG